MKQILIFIGLFIATAFSVSAQFTGYDLNNIIVTSGTENPLDGINELEEDGFTGDVSLDVVNWNVNWLGAPQMVSNKYGTREKHINGVAEIMVEIDADVYALQEVVVDETNGNALEELVAKMNELKGADVFEGSVSEYHSFYWKTDDPEYPPQCLAYVWKKEVITVNNTQALLEDYASYNDFGYGRLPYMLDANVNLNGKSQRYIFINLHLKASKGYSDARAQSMSLVKELLTVNYSDNNVVLLGDYNVADQSGAVGEISDWEIYDDSNGDGIADFVHAAGSKNNGIEHTLISDNLFDELAYTPEYFRNQALNGTGVKLSDHYAYQMRLYVHEETGGDDPKNNPLFSSTGYDLTMTAADYQIIVDYVKNDDELAALDPSDYADSEYYFGSSAYYSNFDIRDDKHHSSFDSWEEAVKEAIATVLLPAKYPNAEKNDSVYKVTFNTYSGKNGTYTFNFECTKSTPDPEFAFTTRTNKNDILKSVVSVYPNPTSGYLTLSGSEEMESFSIVDQTGRTLLTKSGIGNTKYTVDLSNIKKGVYVVLINNTDGKTSTTRFIKH